VDADVASCGHGADVIPRLCTDRWSAMANMGLLGIPTTMDGTSDRSDAAAVRPDQTLPVCSRLSIETSSSRPMG
jgi:hypothetical protein